MMRYKKLIGKLNKKVEGKRLSAVEQNEHLYYAPYFSADKRYLIKNFSHFNLSDRFLGKKRS